jgi:hypothetical protein
MEGFEAILVPRGEEIEPPKSFPFRGTPTAEKGPNHPL